MITKRRATITVGVYYITPLGYCICTYCKHSLNMAGERFTFDSKWPHTLSNENRYCDRCPIDMLNSLEECQVSYDVEHTPVKIF